MQLEHLRLLLAVARHGSISAAAQDAGCSQSAASQALQHIERWLGAAVLDRSRRPLRLTPAGQALVQAAQPFFERLEALRQPSAAAPQGTITIATIPSLGLHLLTGLVQRFGVAHPRVRVHMRFLRHGEVLRQVRDGRADLALISFPPRLPGLEVIPLCDERLLVACHPADPLVVRGSARLADLAGRPFIAFERDLPIRRYLDGAMRAAGLRLTPIMELDNIESIKQAVQSRCGISILPEPSLLREALGRLLVALPIADAQLSRPVAVVRRRSACTPLSERFVAFMRSEARLPLPRPPVPRRYGDTPSPHE